MQSEKEVPLFAGIGTASSLFAAMGKISSASGCWLIQLKCERHNGFLKENGDIARRLKNFQPVYACLACLLLLLTERLADITRG